MNISYRILGYREFCVTDENVTRLINLCMEYHIPYGKIRREGENNIFIFRLHHAVELLKLCRRYNIEISERSSGGLPLWLYRHRQRYGMFAGMLAALFLVVISQQFIWRIDVVGNQEIPTGEILEFLDSYGLRAGTYIPSINADKIQNRMLIDSDKISWVSVNVNGNTAKVEIREREAPKDDEKSDGFANLVASKPGKIVYVKVMQGNVEVRGGDIVNKGDLLVGGVFDMGEGGYKFTRAEGEVYAETVEELYIKIPYEYEKKVYTGNQYYDKYLNFFDFSVKISKNYGNLPLLYDTISIIDNYNISDGEILPISIETHKYLEYEMQTSVRTKEEAEELAYFELSEKIQSVTNNATLLRKVIIPEIHDGFFALRCSVVCIENIAVISEFEAGGS